jgi:hypothetical protein
MRALVLSALGCCLLAGRGLDILRTSLRARRPSVRRIAPLLVAALAIADRFDDAWGQRPSAWPAQYATAPVSARKLPPASRELQIRAPNDAILTRRLNAWGYDPVVLRQTGLLWSELDPELFVFDREGRLASARLDIEPAGLLTAQGLATLHRLGVSQIALGSRRVPIPDAAASQVVKRRRRGRTDLEIPGATRASLGGRGGGQAPAPQANAARGADTSPGEVVVHLPATATAGTLVLADTFYPGWRAYADDGEELAIAPAEGALREVHLHRATRHVAFRYEPFSYVLGLFGSAMGVLLACAAHTMGAPAEKRSPRFTLRCRSRG